MKILKSNLYSFIRIKIGRERDLIHAEGQKKLDKEVDSIIMTSESRKLIEETEALLSNLRENTANICDKFKVYGSSYEVLGTHLNNSSVECNLRSKIEYKLKENRSLNVDNNSKEMLEAFERYSKYRIESNSKLRNLDQLERELNRVVKNASTGKLAHRDLIALGVDMEDLEVEGEVLPAVIKLSVDPCIINKKGCI